MPRAAGSRLEQYTLKRPHEVLLVSARIEGQVDQIAIFKGYSSSLTQATAFDPDVPVLPDQATILSIDRLQGPFNPQDPHYLQQDISWEAFQSLLMAAGV